MLNYKTDASRKLYRLTGKSDDWHAITEGEFGQSKLALTILRERSEAGYLPTLEALEKSKATKLAVVEEQYKDACKGAAEWSAEDIEKLPVSFQQEILEAKETRTRRSELIEAFFNKDKELCEQLQKLLVAPEEEAIRFTTLRGTSQEPRNLAWALLLDLEDYAYGKLYEEDFDSFK